MPKYPKLSKTWSYSYMYQVKDSLAKDCSIIYASESIMVIRAIMSISVNYMCKNED